MEFLAILFEIFYPREYETYSGQEMTSTKVIVYQGDSTLIYRTDEHFVYKRGARESEKQILETLSHPNIIQLLESRIVEGQLELKFPFYSLDLYDYLVNNKLKREDIKIVFKQIVQAVEYCHQRGIVHLDLKLENVMVKSIDPIEVVLIDFGFALHANEKCQTFCGSFCAVAPEILSSIPYNPFQADIWSLGCIYFMLLNQKFPYFADSKSKILCKILSEERETHRDKTEKSEALLVERILKVNPDERVSLQEILLEL